MRLRLRLVSTYCWALIGLTCPIFFVGAALIWAITLPFDRRKVVLHFYSSVWASFYLVANPMWKVRVKGREHLPWRGGAVLVANHASLIDILVLFAQGDGIERREDLVRRGGGPARCRARADRRSAGGARCPRGRARRGLRPLSLG